MSEKKDKVLMIFQSKFMALKIGKTPADSVFDEKTRRAVKTPGVFVQFQKGRFYAKTKEEVEIVREYMKAHQGEIVETDPKVLEKEVRIRKRVAKEVEAEMKAEEEAEKNKVRDQRTDEKVKKELADEEQKEADKAAKDAQKKKEKDQKITDKATKEAEESLEEDVEESDADAEETVEGEEMTEEAALSDMTNSELIAHAEAHGIELVGSDKRNKESLINAITSSNGNPEEPNLDDESED